jgi:curved DNA-binding protein CbpA
MADFYQRLGVSQKAPQDEIRKVYRQLARQYHPDRNPGDKAAEAKFIEINEANATLCDPERRSRYDKLLGAGVFNARTGRAYRPGESAVQDFDPRLFQWGSRVFRMGNFADILSDLDSDTRQDGRRAGD